MAHRMGSLFKMRFLPRLFYTSPQVFYLSGGGRGVRPATFFSDYHQLLADATHPTLILQSQVDSLANEVVGRYIHAHMPDGTLRILPSEGHCIHMTHPDMVRE